MSCHDKSELMPSASPTAGISSSPQRQSRKRSASESPSPPCVRAKARPAPSSPERLADVTTPVRDDAEDETDLLFAQLKAEIEIEGFSSDPVASIADADADADTFTPPPQSDDQNQSSSGDHETGRVKPLGDDETEEQKIDVFFKQSWEENAKKETVLQQHYASRLADLKRRRRRPENADFSSENSNNTHVQTRAADVFAVDMDLKPDVAVPELDAKSHIIDAAADEDKTRSILEKNVESGSEPVSASEDDFEISDDDENEDYVETMWRKRAL